ncbi:cell division protein DamX [Pseudoalteromonas citrea]|uniref:Cell division protein DamX n=1 Tax=Pseudoalteromonas citrea TaxID=43655 RepID=A0A5S3XM28_9GAMM|nr:AAA family ATPase [Pseudoalteromonas citrea]TMP41260.1 cell division protein DamX [Pseudoalteromonas citrea]TMP55466.1 cell division protein DamX [Pseudoalteromonas citrea]
MQSQILPSRAALVNRIELQFEYGQNLICLIGASGLGKSYLAESFITDKYPEFNKAFVKLSAHTKDSELTVQLLQHSFRSPLIDQTLSLSDNFISLHSESSSGPCLWVLDGARHLSDEMVAELQKLAKQTIEKVYILITAQSPMMVPQALDLHLEPLSLLESKALMKMFFSQLPVEEDPIFQAFLNESHGNPAVLLDWRSEEQQLAQPKPSKYAKAQWHLTLLTVLLALLMVAFVYKKEISELVPDKSGQPVVDTVLSSELVFTGKAANDVVAVPSVQEVASTDELDAINDEEQPLIVVNDIPEAVQSIGSGQRRVAAVLSALTEPLDEVSEEEGNLAEGTLEVNKSIEPPVLKDVETKRDIISSENIVSAEHSHLSLLAQADTNWAIQLLAVKDKVIADAFITKNTPRISHLEIYGTRRSEALWWIVVQSGFTTLESAKQAKVQLPSDILAGQPFFKKQTKIKQEITEFAR